MARADKLGQTIGETLDGVTRHVIGMDLHPVAVTLARVTYLLAIGRQRLIEESRGIIHIPVYLGDSMQWLEQKVDLWTAGNLVIRTDDRKELFASELIFPDTLLDDASKFDQLVDELADRASERKPRAPVPSLASVFTRLRIRKEHHSVIAATFNTLCRLHDEGRNHVWGYYVRNLARPLWLSRSGNQVDVLIGNPPWLAYRHMTQDMQETFRSMSEARGLWAGAEIATHQDLSALFAVRTCELYLREGGRFAFVLPNAALDREHYAGFRSGDYGGKAGSVTVSFQISWDLRRIRPHFFPRAASVVFGSKVAYANEHNSEKVTWAGKKMPDEVQIWNGRLSSTNAPWSKASAWLSRTPGKVRHVGQVSKSPYSPLFTQGATFTPRVAFVVETQQTSPLGLPQGRVAIRSSRSVQEKKPWKDEPDLTGVVETEFVRPFFTGDNIYPFRAGPPLLAVLPCNSRGILDHGLIELHPGIQQWWGRANEMWEKNKSSAGMSLLNRLDYQSTLSKQFPIPSLRVVYNRAGMHVVAAKISNRRAIVANGLYWATVQSEDEANFLCAILNAPATTELARPLMSYGKDERDIHKHVWELPIPLFDDAHPVHKRLAELGAAAELSVSMFEIDSGLHFSATRRRIRELLQDTDEGREMNELAFELLG